jgi:hypothetical protein
MLSWALRTSALATPALWTRIGEGLDDDAAAAARLPCRGWSGSGSSSASS